MSVLKFVGSVRDPSDALRAVSYGGLRIHSLFKPVSFRLCNLFYHSRWCFYPSISQLPSFLSALPVKGFFQLGGAEVYFQMLHRATSHFLKTKGKGKKPTTRDGITQSIQ